MWTWTDCKLGYFLLYFCVHYSSALLTIMRIEKFFAVYFPLKTKKNCTVKTAKWICLLTCFVYVSYDCQNFLIWDTVTFNNQTFCDIVHVPANYKKKSFFVLIQHFIRLPHS